MKDEARLSGERKKVDRERVIRFASVDADATDAVVRSVGWSKARDSRVMQNTK